MPGKHAKNVYIPVVTSRDISPSEYPQDTPPSYQVVLKGSDKFGLPVYRQDDFPELAIWKVHAPTHGLWEGYVTHFDVLRELLLHSVQQRGKPEIEWPSCAMRIVILRGFAVGLLLFS